MPTMTRRNPVHGLFWSLVVSPALTMACSGDLIPEASSEAGLAAEAPSCGVLASCCARLPLRRDRKLRAARRSSDRQRVWGRGHDSPCERLLCHGRRGWPAPRCCRAVGREQGPADASVGGGRSRRGRRPRGVRPPRRVLPEPLPPIFADRDLSGIPRVGRGARMRNPSQLADGSERVRPSRDGPELPRVAIVLLERIISVPIPGTVCGRRQRRDRVRLCQPAVGVSGDPALRQRWRD